ncbi:hypothetical protein COJ85_32810 [Bacillus sp. AFS076308]|nr:hypothetical protein COJ85_32810 [Bacillus sp. AFS076308]PGV54841.1 hypothetical protein COD92_03795 [Bacillus sp. AFS037270]
MNQLDYFIYADKFYPLFPFLMLLSTSIIFILIIYKIGILTGSSIYPKFKLTCRNVGFLSYTTFPSKTSCCNKLMVKDLVQKD